jgi:hypothetical protein
VLDLVNSFTKQFIKEGSGAIIFDIDDTYDDEFLENLPIELQSRVEVFDPSHLELVPGLNILDVGDIGEEIAITPDPNKITLSINCFYNIIDRIYNLKATGGPIFEQYFKNALKLVAAHPNSGGTVADICRIMSDEDFRSFKLAMCDDKNVVDFWEKEALKSGGDASFENMIIYITSKMTPFINNSILFRVTAQPKTTVDFKSCIVDDKILFVRLNTAKIGGEAQHILAMLALAQIELVLSDLPKYEIMSPNKPKPTIVIPHLNRFINKNFVNLLLQFHKFVRFIVFAQNSDVLKIENLDYYLEIKSYFPNEIKFRNSSDPDLNHLKDNQAIFSMHLDDLNSEPLLLKIANTKLEEIAHVMQNKPNFYIKDGMTEPEVRKMFDEHGKLLF